MKMNLGKRLIACLLVMMLVCGMITVSSAAVATLGIYFCGVRTATDGTKVTVRLAGQFRVLQNGREAGTIDAGKTTVTLPETGRVRIVPLPETISPEWDLSTAYCEVEPEAGGTTTVPVIVYPLKEKAEATPEPQAAETEKEKTDSGEKTGDDETVDDETGEDTTIVTPPEDVEEENEPAVEVEAGPTPTLPPVDPKYLEPTPEPDKSTLHISGQCWFDETGDGLFVNGEPTLPGIRIELDGVRSGVHYETYSGADGNWCFDNLSPALYNITITMPDGMMFTKLSKKGGKRSIITSGTSRQIDLNDKESRDHLYIGFTWAGEIKGRCFLDANYNGMYDEGELPMPGVKICALKSMDEEAAKTFSGEDGTFVLTGLRGYTYRMRVVLPEDGSDFTRTVSDPLGNHFKSRPGRRENFWDNFVLKEAQTREMNVGVIYPGSITGTVYYDNDFSADKSGNEKIVSGFLVGLYDENGNVAAMDKTNVKGKYELSKLVPGNYTLHVTATKGYAFTKLGEGNVIVNRTGGEGFSEPFFLALGENRTNMDIGMIQPGTVEGSVFADRNDNGIRDDGENGLPGVAVRLIDEETGEEAFRADLSENGQYLFDAVMPGRYHLEYILPENAVFARTVAGGNTISGHDGVGESESFSFASGATVQGPECGVLTLGRIDGLAYHDRNGNGIRDDDEEALAGMTLTLTPSRSELEEITVTTQDDGTYALEALRPDTWTLTVTCPDKNVLSRTDSIKLPLTAGKNTQDVSLDVAMGAQWNDQKLGAVIPASLSGQVWMDENNNGLFDEGESTPAGLEITVTDDLTGKVFDVLRTDEEGRFSTSGMIPGNFTVSFPLDERTIAPKPGDSNFTEEGGKLVVSGIALEEDEAKEGLLLGIVRYTSIGGGVWIDRGDTVDPLAGAEVRLLDESGTVLQTATTGGDGEYLFSNLMPGTYSLDASMPEGCVIIEPDDRRLNETQISVITHATNRNGTSDPIELLMGEDQRKMNIGCVLPGRIGDFCWLDLDKDGLQGMDEPGIPNVRIELLRDGEFIAETETDQYGFWRFEDLYPAVYTLRVTAPDEVVATKQRTDIRIIASVLEEDGSGIFESAEIQVESDKANYNADIGFICKKDGVVPAGTGEGKKQIWTGYKEGD